MAGFYLSESFQILGIAVYVSIVSLFVLGSLKAIRDQASLSKDELRSEIQSLRASNDSLRQAQRLLQEKFRQAAQRPPEVSSVGLFDQDKGQAFEPVWTNQPADAGIARQTAL